MDGVTPPTAISPWLIACLSRELTRGKPLGADIEGRAIVLYRDGNGAPAALDDRCAHRNAPLSAGRVCEGRLQCGYHGWTYNADGSVAAIPALGEAALPPRARVRCYRAQESQGFVWVALDANSAVPAPPHFAHYGDKGWTSFVMKTRFDAPLEACLENFLDCPHATFLHRYWFRSPTDRPVRARVRTLADGAEAEFFSEPREKSLVWSLLAPGGEMRHVDRFIAPRTSRVDYAFPKGVHYTITSSCTALSESTTQVYTVITFRSRWYGPLVKLFFEPLSRRIIRQDVEMLSAQQRNVKRFGGPRFASSSADLLGGHIAAWRRAYATGTPPPAAGIERDVDIRL